jgi:hypothetical protein
MTHWLLRTLNLMQRKRKKKRRLKLKFVKKKRVP